MPPEKECVADISALSVKKKRKAYGDGILATAFVSLPVFFIFFSLSMHAGSAVSFIYFA